MLVLANNLTPFASNNVQLALPSLRTVAASQAWQLQKLEVIIECDSAVSAETHALEGIHIDEETAATSLADRIFKKIDLVRERDEASAAMEFPNTDLITLRKQNTGHANVPSEICDAQDSSSHFAARWISAPGQAKATEGHLAQVTQQLSIAQTKLAHEQPRSMVLEAVLLNAGDAVGDGRVPCGKCTPAS